MTEPATDFLEHCVLLFHVLRRARALRHLERLLVNRAMEFPHALAERRQLVGKGKVAESRGPENGCVYPTSPASLLPVLYAELEYDPAPAATLHTNVKAGGSPEPHFIGINARVEELVGCEDH